jgi:predicted FMN-binding regulatory protein PaiB
MASYTPPTSFKDVPFEQVRPFVAVRALCTLVAVTRSGLVNAHVPVLLTADAQGIWRNPPPLSMASMAPSAPS